MFGAQTKVKPYKVKKKCIFKSKYFYIWIFFRKIFCNVGTPLKGIHSEVTVHIRAKNKLFYDKIKFYLIILIKSLCIPNIFRNFAD